ncbi:MAG TPA: alpha-glucan family phosphorylase [Tepidiformaceae bacterium]|nr:alpha-glucan family phosphorylase [Tepidiformaceae bacterium]
MEPLRQLSRNLYWTWQTDAAELFARIDRAAWHETRRNPVRLLQVVPAATLDQLASEEGFLHHLDRVSEDFAAYLNRPPHVQVPGTSARDVIAYFSMEFGLTESLPNYSGGLGVLAGDHLKSASDLGLPLVGVGLLYHEGYFQQVLAPDGWQSEEREYVDPAFQPLALALGKDGQPLTVEVPMDGRQVRAQVWRLDVGRVPLFLLDTDIEPNAPADRSICGRLYGGDVEMRIEQEMLLGIGGVRALRAMDLHPAVCHMNEGHSALLGIERIRTMMDAAGLSFDEGRLPVAGATVFTTHTAVAAGIDLFPPHLVVRYLGDYYRQLGLDDEKFLGFGRVHSQDPNEPFSMAVLGLRFSSHRNGVSLTHGDVSQRLWESAWPNLPSEQIPIGSITNGVHLPTWVAHELSEVYDTYLGPQWRDEPERPESWAPISETPDSILWGAHERLRESLIAHAREQHRQSVARLGLASGPHYNQPLDPRALTIGFARRFASYKRATLLFRDLDRLAGIVNQPGRPVQFIFAGKAHPRDEAGKQLIREVVEHSRRPEFRDRLVVLERYDVELARSLVQGCDVWLNTPLRPLEASGTSGMKAVANGALHMSVLDGWWAEAYRPEHGWSIGHNSTVDDPEVQDAFDAASLYDLLEHEVVPLFYEREPDGIPGHWVRWMKNSITAFAPVFNTTRMVREYAQRAYEPAAQTWTSLRRDNQAPARDLAAWLAHISQEWPSIKICDVSDSARVDVPGGAPVSVRVQVFLGAVQPEDVRVDVIHGPAGQDGALHARVESPLTFEGRTEDAVCHYTGTFDPVVSGRIGYAVRVLPAHPDLRNPLDTGLVLWA